MERRLRGIDIVSLIFASLCALEAIFWLVMQPSFLRTFADFGSALPVFTRIMLNPLALILPGFVPMALVVEGVVRRRSEATQVAWCVLSIVALLGMLVSMMFGFWLPMLQLRVD